MRGLSLCHWRRDRCAEFHGHTGSWLRCRIPAQNFEAVPKAAGHTQEQSFKQMKHRAAGQAEQRSFEAEVAKELYRLANAPASEYEVSAAPPGPCTCIGE